MTNTNLLPRPTVAWLRMPRLECDVVTHLLNCKDVEELRKTVQHLMYRGDVVQGLRSSHPELLRMVQARETILADKFVATLARYILRMSYRCTPYGAMAGIAALELSPVTNFWQNGTADWHVLHFKNAHTEFKDACSQLQKDPGNSSYITNPGMLIRGHWAQFLDYSEQENKKFFYRRYLDFDTRIAKLLNYLSEVRTFEEIRVRLKIPVSDSAALLSHMEELVQARLVTPLLLESTIRERPMKPVEYFEDVKLRRSLAVSTDLKLEIPNKQLAPRDLEPFAHAVKKLEGISFLSRKPQDPWFKRLTECFVKLYPEQRVPLLDFLLTCPFDLNPTEVNQEFFFKRDWLKVLADADSQNKEVIELDDALLEMLGDEAVASTPYQCNGFSVLASFAKENTEGLEGALHFMVKGWRGRRMFSKHAHLFGDACVQGDGPKLGSYIFADIDGCSTLNSRNLSIRPRWVSHAIRIDPAIGQTDECTIDLRDLLLEFGPSGFRIFHKELKKFVIPIATTNYNFLRDSNPLYRFFAILAFSPFGVDDTHSFFPAGRAFNPRLTIRGGVVSPKTWIFNKETFLGLLRRDDLRTQRNVPAELCLSRGDQKIPINLHNRYIAELIVSEEKADFVVLEEDWHTRYGKKVRINKQDYNHELLFDYFNPVATVAPAATFPRRPYAKKKDQIEQFNLFMPIDLMDVFIDLELSKLLSSLLRSKEITDFFFIRYPEPAPHLRVRLFGVKGNAWRFFEEKLELWRESYLVAQVTQTPFEKEVDLYGDHAGLALYLRLSCLFSHHYLKQRKSFASIPKSRFASIGTSTDVAQLIWLSHELHKHFDLPIPTSGRPMRLDGVHLYKKEMALCWKLLWGSVLSPDTQDGRIFTKEMSLFLKKVTGEIERWKKSNRESKLAIDLLIVRLIHMQVFRFSCGNFPHQETAVYEILDKYLKAIHFSSKSNRRSLR